MHVYKAVIEDNNDPLKIGRVKVRIWGMHTKLNGKSKEFETISVEHLPWAEVMGSTAFGLISGVGVSSVLKKGTWVWIVLEQDDPQKPIILGTVSGIIGEKYSYNNGDGFCDPDAVYPKDTYIGKSDFNLLAQGDKYTTMSVIETASGHTIELDDTAGQEYIKLKHKSGSKIEIGVDGTISLISAANIVLSTPTGKIFYNAIPGT